MAGTRKNAVWKIAHIVDSSLYHLRVTLTTELGRIEPAAAAGRRYALASWRITEPAAAMILRTLKITYQPLDRLVGDHDPGLSGRCQADEHHDSDRGILPSVR